MGVCPVPRVDDGRVQVARQEIRRAGVCMSHDNHIGVHGLKRKGRVVQRFALLHAGAPGGHVDHVRAHHLASLLERCPCSRARLIEERVDRLTPQSRHLPNVPAQDLLHHVRVLQHFLDLLAAEVVEVEHVPAVGQMGPCTLRSHWKTGTPRSHDRLLSRTTSSSPPVSLRCTRTSSSSEVGMFRPT